MKVKVMTVVMIVTVDTTRRKARANAQKLITRAVKTSTMTAVILQQLKVVRPGEETVVLEVARETE